jgi:hypothetical protein
MPAGRPRKFKNRDIVKDDNGNLYVVVGRRLRGVAKAEYRCIPVNKRYERFGGAQWIESNLIHPTGVKSNTASIVTYKANELLNDESEPDRGCRCQCCIHVALPASAFTQYGTMRNLEEE